MAKNQVQFQKGLSLPQFLKQYGTESQCHGALSGFICPECGMQAIVKLRDVAYINAIDVTDRLR